MAVPEPHRPLADGVVTLRHWRDDDVDAIVAACQDPAIARFIPIPRPYGRRDAEDYLARTRRQWEEGSKAGFAVADAADHRVLLGAINLALFESVGNAGYWVAPHARGRHVASRALTLLTAWAFGELGLGAVLLEIRPENAASIATARTAGYRQAGHLEFNEVTGERDGLIFVWLVTDVAGA